MSILDELRGKIRDFRHPEEMDEYEDYDDARYDDAEAPARREMGSGVLGNTRRPEAESVNVFTRSGRPLNSPTKPDYYQQRPSANYASQPASASALSPEETSQIPVQSSYAARANSVLGNTTGRRTPADLGLRTISRAQASGQLPAYLLKPASYDDVQMVVRRVRTNQPVVLMFTNTNIDTAKRILDFCLGLTCGIGGKVEEVADRVFVVVPAGVEVSLEEIHKLIGQAPRAR